MAYRGQSALVTGGGSGMGRLAAQQFAAAGAQVAILDVNEAGLQETAAGSDTIHPFVVDKKGNFDFKKYNVLYFKRLEEKLIYILDLDIQSDLIIKNIDFENLYSGISEDEKYKFFEYLICAKAFQPFYKLDVAPTYRQN